MSYTPAPDEPTEPADSGDPAGDRAGDRKPKRPSNGRIAIWVAVAAVGLYFLGSGIYGIITGGN
ncbi:hypothetical protein [Subtercola sp. YIM 133946]|uniref:hypothetical protein n=1 Tax=Subtercola sp. YIM 133946 TaxID=3118909 RepID=UPI002F91C4B8